MAIFQGFKLVKDNMYTFAKDDAETKHMMDINGWQTCDVIPCRFVRANRWSFPVEIKEDDKIGTLYRLFSRGTYIHTSENVNAKMQDPKFFNWDVEIEAGKSYMVGSSVPTKKFLQTHTSQMTDWQVIAHEYACEHPDRELVISTAPNRAGRNFVWVIWLEGDHVVLGLPHQDCGGEKHWVSHVDRPTRKVLVNVD